MLHVYPALRKLLFLQEAVIHGRTSSTARSHSHGPGLPLDTVAEHSPLPMSQVPRTSSDSTRHVRYDAVGMEVEVVPFQGFKGIRLGETITC